MRKHVRRLTGWSFYGLAWCFPLMPTVYTSHPLAAGHPPVWASAWGQDAYGPWCRVRIREATQRLRWMPPGRFLMGSPSKGRGRWSGEGPRHEVRLTQGFWLFDTPCTQALWQAVMGANSSELQGAQHPVENVSWEDCQRFMAAFNQHVPELPLELPTEAQWEYACRAGTKTPRYAAELDAIAWYAGNSHGITHEVAQKRPNAWGLYDMLGNVWEWCQDGLRTYTRQGVVDPVGPTDAGADRALRGGSWCYPALLARAAIRGASLPGNRDALIGFRGASSGRMAQAQVAGEVSASQR